jgi:PAS domain S-box-containing protein
MTHGEAMHPLDLQSIRQLLDDYLRMYASGDGRLASLLSEDFSGCAGSDDHLVDDRQAWLELARQDGSRLPDPVRVVLESAAIQPVAETVAVATSVFTVPLPVDLRRSRGRTRLVAVLRKEAPGWRFAYCSTSAAPPGAGDAEANAVLAREIAERRQTEERLRESEALYRSILNASPDDITIADLEGTVLMVSPNAVAMFGFRDEAQGLGRKVTDFLVPEDRERAMSRVAMLLRGVPSGPSEYRGLRLDGTTLDIEVNSALIRDGEGRPSKLVVIARDITARKQTEAELQKAHEQIRTLRGLLPICMHCKKIRDDRGHWSPVEVYVRERTDAEFSHGICPQCLAARYPELPQDEDGQKKA